MIPHPPGALATVVALETMSPPPTLPLLPCSHKNPDDDLSPSELGGVMIGISPLGHAMEPLDPIGPADPTDVDTQLSPPPIV